MDHTERFRAESAWPKIAIPIVVVALVCAAAAYRFYVSKPDVIPSQSAAAPETASAPPAPSTVPPTPEISHPLENPTSGAIESAADVHSALDQTFGGAAVGRYLEPDDFVHRAVATLDNLGRPLASPMLWPVKPAPGKFLVETTATGTVISNANAQRYTPIVHWVSSLNAAQMADLYVRMYPLLQHQYQALGYPKGYLNDRVVTVIDTLLATPDVKGPIAVQLTNVEGPIRDERPWTRYQYADPTLEGLSSGQKMLLRTGPENEAVLKAKLRDLKAELDKHVAAHG